MNEETECPNCGSKDQDGNFCSVCGELLADPPEDPAIPATLRTDDYALKTIFDAVEWFRTAEPWRIEKMEEQGWADNIYTDGIAGSSSDPVVRRIFRYLSVRIGEGGTATYSCSVDREAAIKWLEENRPEVAEKLEEDNG